MKRISSALPCALAGTALVACTLPVSAQTTTLTFDAQSTGPFTTLTEGDYALTYVAGDQQAVQTLGAGNKALVDSNPNNMSGSLVNIARIDGDPFSLTALDVANLNNPGGSIPVFPGSGFRIELRASNGADHVYGPGSSTLTTENPTDLTNITFARLNIFSASGSATFAVDNIVLEHTAATPEPGTLALLASVGLTGGGVLRKRRASARK